MDSTTIVDKFWERVSDTPERKAILHKVGGTYRPVIWREQGRVVELIAGGLLKMGVMKDDKVAIISQSRPHWCWADMAILSSGGVTVPIYPTLAFPEVRFLLRHSDAVGVFVDTDKQLKKVLDSLEHAPNLKFVVLMDGEITHTDSNVRVMKWDDLMKDGEVHLLANPNQFSDRRKNIRPDDIATIVYTSGTTGVPKGVMLTHRNIYSVCAAMNELVGFKPDDLSLSFLPLSHVYERVGGEFLATFTGLVMAFAESMETVPKNMVEVKPTVLSAVPRFYEKAYTRIQAEVRNLPKAQQYLIRWALALGRRAQKLEEELKGHNKLIAQEIYKAELRVADRLVFSKIRRRFGGRLRVMVSGAAPLSDEVQGFFDTLGLHIVEGYGLTETAAPVACNTPEDNHHGTVGKPLPGIEVKIADDGEILVRGPSVFAGYYKNEEATQEAFRDGWFLTGDIGEIDKEGYLRVKDRKKDIIITAGGKHVAPQYLENLYKGEPLISQILVYGDRRKYITALVTLNEDGLKNFARLKGLAYDRVQELVHHPAVRNEIEALINRKNEPLASFERIKKFAILDGEFTVESEELTPTYKVKRKLITEKYKTLLDTLYETSDLEVQETAVKPAS